MRRTSDRPAGSCDRSMRDQLPARIRGYRRGGEGATVSTDGVGGGVEFLVSASDKKSRRLRRAEVERPERALKACRKPPAWARQYLHWCVSPAARPSLPWRVGEDARRQWGVPTSQAVFAVARAPRPARLGVKIWPWRSRNSCREDRLRALRTSKHRPLGLPRTGVREKRGCSARSEDKTALALDRAKREG
eukprot:6214789-Pleurochrysis_carterae.AAC.2